MPLMKTKCQVTQRSMEGGLLSAAQRGLSVAFAMWVVSVGWRYALGESMLAWLGFAVVAPVLVWAVITSATLATAELQPHQLVLETMWSSKLVALAEVVSSSRHGKRVVLSTIGGATLVLDFSRLGADGEAVAQEWADALRALEPPRGLKS